MRPYHTVTVITGVYEYDLNEFLVKNGLSMLSQPLNVNETVGGMLALSTHVSVHLAYNITRDKVLSVTCGRSVVFSGYSGFYHQ